MTSGYGFVEASQPTAGVFFENQKIFMVPRQEDTRADQQQQQQQQQQAPSEQQSWSGADGTRSYDTSHSSVPLLQQFTGPVTPESYPAGSRPLRYGSSREQQPPPPPPPEHDSNDPRSVPLFDLPRFPITPSSQPIQYRRPTKAEPPEADDAEQTAGFIMPDRPSVPVHYSPHQPLISSGPQAAPTWKKPAPPSKPKSTGPEYPSVPLHVPDNGPVLPPSGPPKPIWEVYRGSTKTTESAVIPDTGMRSVSLSQERGPILPPSGPPKPIWEVYSGPSARDSAAIPDNGMESISLSHQQGPILPPSGPIKPIWVEYPDAMRSGGSGDGVTYKMASDRASLNLSQKATLPILQPNQPTKAAWLEYSGNQRSKDGVMYGIARDRASVELHAERKKLVQASDVNKPLSYSGGTKSRDAFARSLAADHPSIRIGPEPKKKVDQVEKSADLNWKPVMPTVRKDSPSVALHPEGEKKAPTVKVETPEPEKEETLELIRLYPAKPEKQEVITLYPEDPTQEADLWVHTPDLAKKETSDRGPYVTKLVVSDTGRIPLSQLHGSSCPKSDYPEARRTSSTYRTYYGTGEGTSENYAPQCTS